ncbi:hypothetical protein BH11ACT1_BH11ACT1_18080 [soil metagenome]
MFTTPSTFTRQLESVHVELPKAARVALDALTALRTALDTTPTANDFEAPGKLTAASAADALHELARRLTVHEKSGAAHVELQRIAVTQFHKAIRSNADQLITALRKPFDEAATIVHTAGRHFPPGASHAAILAAGPEAASAWHQLGAAITQLDTIRSLRMQIGDVAGHGEQTVEWYIESATDAKALEAAQRAYTGVGNAFHALAAAGFTLRLNTEDEAHKVANLAVKVSTERAKADEDAALKDHRESWAPSLAAMSSTE